MVPSVNRSRHQSRHRRSRLVDVDKIHKTLKKVQASWHGKMMRRVNYVWNLGTYLALPVDPYPSVVHGKGMARRLTKFKRLFFRCSGSMAQSASSQRPRGSTSSRTFPFWLSEKPVLGWWCWQWILPYLTISYVQYLLFKVNLSFGSFFSSSLEFKGTNHQGMLVLLPETGMTNQGTLKIQPGEFWEPAMDLNV